MASSSPSSSHHPPSSSASPKIPRPTAKSTSDPILRNALRYTISAKEYETLHKYIISRSKVLRRNAPTVSRVEKLVEPSSSHGTGGAASSEFNVAAVRATLRLFIVTAAGLQAWEAIKARIAGSAVVNARGKKLPFWRSPNLRLSLSLSTILLLHRILYRFFTRLRAHLLTDEARPFRQRNKRTSNTLTSSLAPAIGASLAGFGLAVYPKDQLRVTIAISALAQAAEYAYNLAEDEGWIWGKGKRPWWWGSWLLFPLTSGQLLHAFVFDRETFPAMYGNFILRYSPEYMQKAPAGYPSSLSWPTEHEVVDSLAQTARLKYPTFISPILFPNKTTLPSTLSTISPITSPAHPLITSLTCAILHPSDPSCLRTYLTYWLRIFPCLARVFTAFYLVISLPAYKQFYISPLSTLNNLAKRILRTTAFASGFIGTTWGSICLFQALLPANFLATRRFFLSGALGGLWSFIIKSEARGVVLATGKESLDSLWKVGRKRGWWKGVRGGDVWVFVASLMVVNAVFERDPKAVTSGMLRKSLSSLRGEGWRDVEGLNVEDKKRRKEQGEQRN